MQYFKFICKLAQVNCKTRNIANTSCFNAYALWFITHVLAYFWENLGYSIFDLEISNFYRIMRENIVRFAVERAL